MSNEIIYPIVGGYLMVNLLEKYNEESNDYFITIYTYLQSTNEEDEENVKKE